MIRNLTLRRLATLFLLCILGSSPIAANAQDPIATLNSELRRLFSSLTNPNAGVRFLYDRSVKRTDSAFYRKISYDSSNVENWYLMYEEMYYAAYDTTAHLRADTVFKRADRRVSNDTIPIGIMNWRFNKLKPDALTTNTYFNFDTVVHKVYDKSPRPSSPYLIDTLFAASPLVFEVDYANVTFQLGKAFLFADTSLRMDTRVTKVDFGDGLGWITIYGITTTNSYRNVVYPTAGIKVIKVATFSSATGPMLTLSTSLLNVLSATVPETATDYITDFEGLTLAVYESCVPAAEKKYFFYLEGLDILDDENVFDLYENRIKRKGLAELRNFGYDIVVIDYDDPYASIITNGQRFIKVLEHYRCLTPNPAPFVVMGESMGGLVANYALTYMESPSYVTNACSANKMHNTRLLLTLDSPHDGANIPLAIQHLYRKLSVFGWIHSTFAEGMNAKYGTFLDGQAAKEMLIYHVNTDVMPHTPIGVSPYSHASNRSSFKATMAAIGNYPQFCKKVAISNGSFLGIGQLRYNNTPPQPERIPNDFLFKLKTDTYLKVLWFKIVGANTDFELRTNPDGTGEVFKASAGISHWKIKLKWFGVKIEWGSTDLIKYSKIASGVKSYCVRAASNLGNDLSLVTGEEREDTNPDWVKFLGYTADVKVDEFGNMRRVFSAGGLGAHFLVNMNVDITAYSDGLDFGFIPVQSSFGYTPAALNRNLSLDPISYTFSQNPFDVVITNPQLNRYHLDLANPELGKYESCTASILSRLVTREIGDDSLYLENYRSLPPGVTIEAERRLLVNYRNPLYNYQSQPASDPAYNLPAHVNYIISRENPLTVGGAPPILRSNQPVMVNPAQPIVGPYTIAPGFMTLCCHSYSSRPAAFEEQESLIASKGYLKLYPNPTNGQHLNIVYQFAQNATVSAELYDITGRLIDAVEMPFNDNTLECYFILDVQKLNLSAGTYVLRLKANQEEYVQKFVITK